MSETKPKINIDRVVAIIGLLLTIGLGGYIKTIWNDSVESALVEKLEDKHSKVYQMIRAEADSVAAIRTRSMMRDVFESEASRQALAMAFEGFRGMDNEQLVEYLNDKFDFADSIQAMIPEIQKNHKWVAEQMEEDHQGEQLEVCGTVYSKNDKPVFFKECDGDLKPIVKGKPRAHMNQDVYYYRDDNDNPIILSYLSPIVINN